MRGKAKRLTVGPSRPRTGNQPQRTRRTQRESSIRKSKTPPCRKMRDKGGAPVLETTALLFVAAEVEQVHEIADSWAVQWDIRVG